MVIFLVSFSFIGDLLDLKMLLGEGCSNAKDRDRRWSKTPIYKGSGFKRAF